MLSCILHSFTSMGNREGLRMQLSAWRLGNPLGLKPSPTMYHALVNAYAQRVTIVAQVTFGGVMFTNHFLLKNRVNKVIKDQKDLTYLAREVLKAQKLINEIDAEGSDLYGLRGIKR
ncbi:hypothetical protein GIB67_014947 [Kingdonia uniflora]|uniref:Uncharacterized protein n=1 Tax=Kingdonia uniflora TaxID=39325 RepID=A0A7J7MTG2_9MAGN|nr:hypothetical protein GIB67_014947 [Kingdonia uniflora]